MKIYKGFEYAGETEDEVIQYRYFPPENGKPGCNMTIRVPKHTDPEERRRGLAKVSEILLNHAARLERQKAEMQKT